ncbi:MAG: helix-turn-helix domain-containing protein [Desulfobacterales bacterium]|nr:helix-turn-helix domain-containing protein [Desulfobacterales bacterium]
MKQFLLKNSFSDFDKFAHTIQDFDLDFLQLDIGAFKANLIQLATDKSIFAHIQFNRRLDQRGSPPPEDWTFAIFAEHSTPIVWHEQEISTNTIAVYKPGSEVDCVSRPGFDVFTISYPEEYLNWVCSYLDLPEIKKLANNYDNFECNMIDLFKIRCQLQQIIEFLKDPSIQIDNASFINDLDVHLPEQILLALAGSRYVKIASANLRKHSIKLIKDYLVEFPQELVTVSQLCTITGASRRTLQYAFQEHYGLSPKTYLNNYRLNAVRRELKKCAPFKTKVNDAASLWGFWHMGKFAADYRKLFGELPSETLKHIKF